MLRLTLIVVCSALIGGGAALFATTASGFLVTKREAKREFARGLIVTVLSHNQETFINRPTNECYTFDKRTLDRVSEFVLRYHFTAEDLMAKSPGQLVCEGGVVSYDFGS